MQQLNLSSQNDSSFNTEAEAAKIPKTDYPSEYGAGNVKVHSSHYPADKKQAYVPAPEYQAASYPAKYDTHDKKVYPSASDYPSAYDAGSYEENPPGYDTGSYQENPEYDTYEKPVYASDDVSYENPDYASNDHTYEKPDNDYETVTNQGYTSDYTSGNEDYAPDYATDYVTGYATSEDYGSEYTTYETEYVDDYKDPPADYQPYDDHHTKGNFKFHFLNCRPYSLPIFFRTPLTNFLNTVNDERTLKVTVKPM